VPLPKVVTSKSDVQQEQPRRFPLQQQLKALELSERGGELLINGADISFRLTEQGQLLNVMCAYRLKDGVMSGMRISPMNLRDYLAVLSQRKVEELVRQSYDVLMLALPNNVCGQCESEYERINRFLCPHCGVISYCSDKCWLAHQPTHSFDCEVLCKRRRSIMELTKKVVG
jgi:hypothetical protein